MYWFYTRLASFKRVISKSLYNHRIYFIHTFTQHCFICCHYLCYYTKRIPNSYRYPGIPLYTKTTNTSITAAILSFIDLLLLLFNYYARPYVFSLRCTRRSSTQQLRNPPSAPVAITYSKIAFVTAASPGA